MKENKIQVLVAEDDFFVTQDILRTLKQLGYEVAGMASNGEAAVDLAQSLKPDVILMDIKMPKMDGLQASEIIQSRRPTPIVILSAYETEEFVQKAARTGVGAYLTKPPKAAEIDRAISISMARHADLMEARRLYQELETKNKALRKALTEIETLRQLIPICSNCKKVRNDDGYWEQIDHYLRVHSDIKFTHGICPDCLKKLYPDFANEILEYETKTSDS